MSMTTEQDLRTQRAEINAAHREVMKTESFRAEMILLDLLSATGSANRLTPALRDTLMGADLDEATQETVWRGAANAAVERVQEVWRATPTYNGESVLPAFFEMFPTYLDVEPCTVVLQPEGELRIQFDSEIFSDWWGRDNIDYWFTLVMWEAIHGPEGVIAWMQSLLDPQPSEDTEVDYLLDGLIARGDRQVIFSETGQGKSWLLMQIAVGVAQGIDPFTGEPLKGGPRKVLYIDLEMGEADMRARLEVLCPDGIPKTLLARSLADEKPDVTDPKTMSSIQATVELFKPELIIIGPVKNLMGGAPMAGNSPHTARAYSALADLMQDWALRGSSRRAVVFEHHTTKGGSSITGDGSLEANATHTVHLRNSGKFKLVKQRNYRAWEKLGQLVQAAPEDSGDGSWSMKTKTIEPAQQPEAEPAEATEETKEQVVQRVRAYVEEHPDDSQRVISEATGIPRSSVQRALKVIGGSS